MPVGSLKAPEPVIVAGLFAEERAALLEVLASLSEEEWDRPTVCDGWTVHDVVVHLLGGYAGNLSRRRDRFTKATLPDGDGLADRINRFNAVWVEAVRRLSPRVLIALIDQLGEELDAYFASIDPSELGGAVAWAGGGPAPVWLDIAREFTEHWHHQQHIRDAVGRPALDSARLLHPVLATFVFALPATFRDVAAPEGTTVALTIAGPAVGDWTVIKEGAWKLFQGAPVNPDARAAMPQEIAWCLFTKGIAPERARAAARVEGNARLVNRLFEAVAIIA